MTRVAVIGYGLQIKRLLGIMKQQDDSCAVAAIADPRSETIRGEMIAEGADVSGIRFYADADEMLDHGPYDGVCIGTRCSLHTEMAVKVLAKGWPLYVEKPISTTMADLIRLRDAYERSARPPVVVSFPLRVTPHVQLVKSIIDSGKIGTVEHVQAVNNVAYGGVYFHYWYRDERETQGLFLQKATHDLDYISYVLGANPRQVCAMTSKRIFTGSKPAGLMCKDCEDQDTCQESPQNLRKAGEVPIGDYCCFAVDTGNEDSGSVIIQYESGMHVNYSQNFFVRKKAGARGARFMGYKGTVEFDWHSSDVKVYMHHTPVVETHSIDLAAFSGGHGGGDDVLIGNFIDIMKGRTAVSISPIEAGLLSALTCLKAKASAETGTFQAVSWPDR
ncbi:Gfo/Idh/MocA family protein [Cohnella hashimotonis]|uniref:Gfo/Idh/MocA family oxidoreductase n=1 Tax=Cohnella hashimotonis TaxID=2826895 RepID=A0ABT6TRS1_9BACL|nr:Gfo/Idh/MocA family oxidoreductase [Cohnella hashimotonis]MDI4649549.1 Gfo/Idh/MocA family oxidoreductase [Cohnella hashimotonis]